MVVDDGAAYRSRRVKHWRKMMSVWKRGFKVVEVVERAKGVELTSNVMVTLPARWLYYIGRAAIRPDNQGPAAVFDCLEHAQRYVMQINPKNWELAIYECLYLRSAERRLYCTAMNQQKLSDFPTGTDFADIVVLCAKQHPSRSPCSCRGCRGCGHPNGM